jgi:hypothetical protein
MMPRIFGLLSYEEILRQEAHWHGYRVPNGGNPQGTEAEMRFLRICREQENLGFFPEWLYEIRPGTQFEDTQSIDAVAVTTCGEIPLQIKSSVRGRDTFVEKSENAHISCILVASFFSDADIFRMTLDEINLKYELLCVLRAAIA